MHSIFKLDFTKTNSGYKLQTIEIAINKILQYCLARNWIKLDKNRYKLKFNFDPRMTHAHR